MMSELVLKGIDGANPLGFLAAVGMLRASTHALYAHGTTVRLYWGIHMGGWRPSIVLEGEQTDPDFLMSNVTRWLSDPRRKTPFNSFSSMVIDITAYREVVKNPPDECLKKHDRAYFDFLAAFGSDAVMEGQIPTTALCLNRSHEFFRFVLNLIDDTQESHLQKTLFEMWKYDDPVETHAMRWDPREDIRHALRWTKPEGDPARKREGTMWGANRLAIEALPLFPTAWIKNFLGTTGCSMKNRKQFFTWPIWSPPIGLYVLKSVLSMREFHEPSGEDREKLKRIGVVEIFQSQKVLKDKYKNFGPAEPI